MSDTDEEVWLLLINNNRFIIELFILRIVRRYIYVVRGYFLWCYMQKKMNHEMFFLWYIDTCLVINSGTDFQFFCL